MYLPLKVSFFKKVLLRYLTLHIEHVFVMYDEKFEKKKLYACNQDNIATLLFVCIIVYHCTYGFN